MDTTQRGLIMQRWGVVQRELMPELRSEIGPLTSKLEKVIHTLEWVRIEEFVESSWCGVGRPPHDRGALASAFVAKAVLGLTTTEALIEPARIARRSRRKRGRRAKSRPKPAVRAKRGHPRKDAAREPKFKTVARQVGQSLTEMLAALPKACDRGTQRNVQGYKISGNG